MSIAPLRHQEKDISVLCDRLRSVMEGRMLAHGAADIDNDGVATSTTVIALTCAPDSHVPITPEDANAAALTGVYVVPAKGQFVIHHAATASASTFRWSIHG